MQKHTKIYLDYFGHSKLDFEYISCEVCKFNQIVDVHHIKHGASGRKNNIENLIGICRSCHTNAHNEKPGFRRHELQLIHDKFIANNKY